MRKSWFLLGFIVSTVCELGATELISKQTQWLAKAERHEKAGWTYLHLEGEPAALGFQHGYLMAKEIAESLRVTRALWLHESGMEWTWLVSQSRKFISPAVDPENKAEIDGIVEGLRAAGVTTTSDELIAYNAYFELDWYWWPDASKKLDDAGDGATAHKKQSCSSFIATGSMTTDGGIVLGHNTMFDYTYAIFNVVVDIVPAKGHRILMQTQPGWIHSGTDFFVTDAGLVGSETTIGGFHGFSEKGVPEFARMREHRGRYTHPPAGNRNA